MPGGRVAAGALAARVRQVSTGAAVGGKASRRRPRCLSTAPAATAAAAAAAAAKRVVGEVEGSHVTDSACASAGASAITSRKTGGGQLVDLLSLTLARSVHDGEEITVAGPRRALPWASRRSSGGGSGGDGGDLVSAGAFEAFPSADVSARSTVSTRAACVDDEDTFEKEAAAAAAAAASVVPRDLAMSRSRRSHTDGSGGSGVTCGADGTLDSGLAAYRRGGSSSSSSSEVPLRNGLTAKELAAFQGRLWLQERLGLSEQQSAKIVLAAPLSFHQGEGRGGGGGRSFSPSFGFSKGGAADVPMDANTLDVRLRWLVKRLGLDERGVRKVVRGFPRIFATSVESDLEPRLAWLKTGLTLDPSAIRKLVVSFPTLFSKSVEDGLEAKLSWMEKRLKLTRGELSKIVVKYPTLLSYSVEDNLEPSIRWLEERLGLDDIAVRKMVQQFPAVLGYSIEDNLEPKLSWLQSELGLDLVGSQRLVRLAPPILGASIDDNLRHKLPRLQEFLEMSRESVVSVLIRKPALLALDADNNIEPKVRFFLEEMGASREDIRGALKVNSSLLMYSLEKRWRPRLEHMRSLNIEPVFSSHWRPMATRDEQSFRAWLEQVSPAIGMQARRMPIYPAAVFRGR